MIWNKTYETGNPIVDNDHKEIFMQVDGILSDAFVRRSDKLVEHVDFLTGYVARHFENEEKLMDESSYPDSEQHKKKHNDCVQVVAKLRERLVNEAESLELGREVHEVLINWLHEHVLGSDKTMAEHYRKWNEGSK